MIGGIVGYRYDSAALERMLEYSKSAHAEVDSAISSLLAKMGAVDGLIAGVGAIIATQAASAGWNNYLLLPLSSAVLGFACIAAAFLPVRSAFVIHPEVLRDDCANMSAFNLDLLVAERFLKAATLLEAQMRSIGLVLRIGFWLAAVTMSMALVAQLRPGPMVLFVGLPAGLLCASCAQVIVNAVGLNAR